MGFGFPQCGSRWNALEESFAQPQMLADFTLRLPQPWNQSCGDAAGWHYGTICARDHDAAGVERFTDHAVAITSAGLFRREERGA